MTFESTSSAIGAEHGLLPLLPVRVMPTLRQISASCGISLRVEPQHYPALERALRLGVVAPGTYRLYLVERGEAREVI
ncbi:DUF3343 domain-containing protein [Oscillibacter sp.]|uniref:DUF3343 domain-containing protein n=1 Tax=Oscillibacter sp. TaxID=1945593 RepID=UPI00261E5456|nr:DUF3343 domain-containing protein [Oscillibacter sp.]MDD3346590.1 DUF3343 domain-containing protein [Oscillibacter sp.]